MRIIKRPVEKITLDWKFTFGKHKGRLIGAVPPSYLAWAYQNIDWFKKLVDKDKEVKALIKDAEEKIRECAKMLWNNWDENDIDDPNEGPNDFWDEMDGQCLGD